MNKERDYMADLRNLTVMRDKIAKIDEQILQLLEERIDCAKTIGDIKRANGKEIYVPEVEREKIKRLSAASRYPDLSETIWPVIMCYTRSIE